MTRLRPNTRKWLLFTHVVASIGWIGVELSIVALGAVGLLSDDTAVVRGVQLSAGTLGEIFYLPASLLTLISGIALSLGTKWGLVRYWWVVVKIAITLALTIGGNLAVVPKFAEAADRAARGEAIGGTAVMLVTAMSAGLTLLLIATLLSFFKPGGKISAARARIGSLRNRRTSTSPTAAQPVPPGTRHPSRTVPQRS
ncbi:hypothetical protein [Amycolatopsis sp. YIM 10]|uniref:hypothetical protein n=1 Tax=Amycolatopsis sp. YIM 10 TaxID=2653857 RepID=UPI0012AA9C0F|nr:hypothetical protein [Amycolatopsis sp. YIM 10]QFU86380.1 hypothetical protein YIM_05810 [Amycolatopsis sp. YIM 10]